MKQRKFSGSRAVACLLLAGGSLLAAGCETEPSNTPVITEVKPTTLTVTVLDEETMGGIDQARLIASPLAGGDPIDVFTGSDGIAVLPRVPGGMELKLFPPGHLPMYVNVEPDADSATLVTSTVDAEPEVNEDEVGAYIAPDSGEMILRPNGAMPTSFQVRSLPVTRDMDSVTSGAFGSAAQSYYRGALPEGAHITIGATWAAAAGAPVDVYFIDALTGKSVAKVSGSFGQLSTDRVVSFVAPKLDAAPEGTFIVALADLAPDPEAAEAAAGVCAPAGSWDETCGTAAQTTTALLNCCSAASGSTCSATTTLTVAAAVSVTVPNFGSVSVTATVSTAVQCATPAGTCERQKLAAKGCAYLVCNSFGLQKTACQNHGCYQNRCKAKTCAVPLVSCPAAYCSGTACVW